ncbi:MAG: recombinase family protein [Oscillospiraceae bacterium]|jgi:DNA invertase Pin-like site-specific DNA recombinase|nr:recombinase family protein [Oscillospiraceae bacterium]
MRTWGYSRVSTSEQHLYRQIHALTERGIAPENILTDKQSGKDTARPGLKKLLVTAKKGDTVIVESFSRFSRSTRDLLDLVENLTAKGVEFISLKENIDTSVPAGKFMLTVFAALYEFERETTLQRQREGIAAARLRGVHLGRPPKRCPENFVETVKLWERGKIKFNEVLERTELKKTTFYALLREHRAKTEKKHSS